MNLVLLLVIIAEFCLATCVWLTPECLRRLAAHLLTRADVIDVAKKENDRRIQFWRGELGLAQDSSARNDLQSLAPLPPLIRR